MTKTLRAGLVQLSSSDDPAANLRETLRLCGQAVDEGAALVLTPEVTNIISLSRTRQTEVLAFEDDDITLAGLRAFAAKRGVWVSLGSIALKTGDPDGRFANRSFMIDASGEIVARYDKIHMFDAAPGADEAYRESRGYRPGDTAVLAHSPWGPIGLTICYDMRFPALYRALAEAGAGILIAPSAFTRPTGRAHWSTLLRARAIETGCFMLAAAQCGRHAASRGPRRETYGHSIAVSPWGEIVAEAGDDPTILICDLDLNGIETARQKIPSLTNARAFSTQF